MFAWCGSLWSPPDWVCACILFFFFSTWHNEKLAASAPICDLESEADSAGSGGYG